METDSGRWSLIVKLVANNREDLSDQSNRCPEI